MDAPGGLAERVIAPLARASLENALQRGQGALTGPVARGDAAAVARHLDALAEVAPETGRGVSREFTAHRAAGPRPGRRIRRVGRPVPSRGTSVSERKPPKFSPGELNVYRSPRDVSDVSRALRTIRSSGDAGADHGRPARRSSRTGQGGQAGSGRGGRGFDLRQPTAVRCGRGPRRLSPSARGRPRGAALRGRRGGVHPHRLRHVPRRATHDRPARAARS